MKTSPLAAAILLGLGALAVNPAALADDDHQRAPFAIGLQPIASVVTSTTVGKTAAEIVAYDAETRRAFAINSQENELVIIDLKPLATRNAPVVLAKLSMAAYGAGLNSVAVHDGLVAVAVEAADKTQNGQVVFLSARANDLSRARAFEVGALPDHVSFTADGEYLLVANEGEPNSYGQPTSVNPEGSVSIINLKHGLHRASVRTASFAGFNGQKDSLVASGVRVFSPGATVAQDLEPEYITSKGRTAWVTLQEANAIAVLDIPSATFSRIVPLGYKDHNIPGQGLDPSDRDAATNGGINIANWPVRGLYLPDAIASFRARDGQTYLVTANEGDSRTPGDFPGMPDEEARISTLTLDPTAFPTAASLKNNARLGRLKVTKTLGDTDSDGDYDALYAFGARSLTIRSATGDLVWDSGDQLEQYLAANTPADFNKGHDDPTFDIRSDDKGPEPEGVVVGRIAGRTFAFIGLERVGGVFAYDVTDPAAPTLAAYANSRATDLGTEGLAFIKAKDSPTRKPLVLVGNEVSRTVAVYEVTGAPSEKDRD
jgi:hypothetical protein